MKTNRSIKNSKGFTLLEVIIALSIMVMLVSGIFTITKAILSLSQTSLTNQSNQRHSTILESYFRDLFKDLPQDSISELTVDDLNFPVLNIENPGTYYPSAGKDLLATYMNIRTVKNRDGLLSLQASWSNQDLTTLNQSSEAPEMNQVLILLDNLTSLEWEIYSSRDRSWYSLWNTSNPKPTHFRLKYSTAEDQQKYTHTFWVSPKQRT